MIAFIDENRKSCGVEPICKVLPIAPSTYHAHVTLRRDPGKRSTRRGALRSDPARLRGKLLSLRRAQSLAAIAARGRERRALHSGSG
jgi:hypothetical protein